MAICTKLSDYSQIIPPKSLPEKNSPSPKNSIFTTQKEFTLEDFQYARAIAAKCWLMNQSEIQSLIAKEKNPKKQALLITHIIDTAAQGFGTDDSALAAAIYSISKENYSLVDKYLSQFGRTYKGTGIKNYILEETSAEAQKDFLRHINQFEEQK